MPGPNTLLNYFLNSSRIGIFTEEEKLLALNVFSIASEEVKVNVGINSDDDSDNEEDDVAFKEKVEATMKNFKEIIRLFQEAENARKKYEKQFPTWSPLRQENTAKLRELSEKINTDRLNCNISKLTSTCVSILGSAAVGAALVFPPAAPLLAAGGLTASALGGATVFGTSVTEMKLLKKHMEEAEKVKKKEEKDFKLVALWFKHTQELIDAFDNIMGFSVASQVSEDLKNFAADLSNAARLRNGRLNSGLENIIKNCVTKMIPPGIGSAISHLSPAMALIPLAISFFVVIVCLRKHNSLVFDSVVLSHRIAFGMLRLLDLGGDLGVVICAAAMKAGGAAATEVTKNTARVVAHGVFAGIGLALDVTNLVFASVDVHKGSISPYATKLQQAADQLEKEHEVLSKIYKELFK